MKNPIDQRIISTCFELGDWPLSRVFLKNNALYPWFILVPRYANIQDMDQLPTHLQHTLMDEISALSSITKTYFKPTKLNVGTLGNIVPQLHIHVVARFASDKLWPHSVWQAALETKPYEENRITTLLNDLRPLILNQIFSN